MHRQVQFSSLEEIESAVRKFEACEFRKEDFTHSLHLAVAAWYASQFTPEEAVERMRSSLLPFTKTKHLGVKAYHETITRFWLCMIENFLEHRAVDRPLVTKINSLVELYADKRLLFQYYSRELVMSDKAKAEWVEPDLKQIRNELEIGESGCLP